MAKDLAIGKRLKIDKAKQNMLAAVAIASLIFGVSLVFAVYFLRYIKFNSAVISEKNKAIQGYSDAIRDIGVCKKPSGNVYNSAELQQCDPNDPELLNNVPGTLRYNVITDLSQNEALESVGRTGLPICYDSSTKEKLSFSAILERYRYATSDTAKENYLNMIGMCSALRVIPDALPSSANPLALGASLNKIFQLSQFDPEGITPGSTDESSLPGIGSLSVNLEIESSAETTMRVLNNLEKSIREINIRSARIERAVGMDVLKVEATASAYYTEPVTLNEHVETVRGDGSIETDADLTEEAI